MPDFVQLWVYLSSAPLFGLTATLVVYVLAHGVYARTGQAPWANPVLWSIVVLGVVLTLAQIPYQTYFAGAQFIHFLLGPAVVALGFPLWARREELKRKWTRLLIAALAGGATASIVAVGLGWAVGLPEEVLRSLAPKSVTAPVAMGVAEKIGGVPALAAVFAVLAGLIGALSAGALFKLLGILAPAAPTGCLAASVLGRYPTALAQHGRCRSTLMRVPTPGLHSACRCCWWPCSCR